MRVSVEFTPRGRLYEYEAPDGVRPGDEVEVYGKRVRVVSLGSNPDAVGSGSPHRAEVRRVNHDAVEGPRGVWYRRFIAPDEARAIEEDRVAETPIIVTPITAAFAEELVNQVYGARHPAGPVVVEDRFLAWAAERAARAVIDRPARTLDWTR